MREPLLSKLLDGYDLAWSAAEKNKFLSNLLELKIEATEHRLFHDEPVCRVAQCSDGVPLTTQQLRCPAHHAASLTPPFQCRPTSPYEEAVWCSSLHQYPHAANCSE
jgi:hypothetical protein